MLNLRTTNNKQIIIPHIGSVTGICELSDKKCTVLLDNGLALDVNHTVAEVDQLMKEAAAQQVSDELTPMIVGKIQAAVQEQMGGEDGPVHVHTLGPDALTNPDVPEVVKQALRAAQERNGTDNDVDDVTPSTSTEETKH